VITWIDQPKAVLVAISKYESEHAVTVVEPLDEIRVEVLGPAPRQPDGTVALGHTDVIDRLEW
jgi:hypothetical protein